MLSAQASRAISCPSFGPNTPSGSTLSTLAPSNPTAARLCHYATGHEKAPMSSLMFSKRVADPKALARLLNQAKRITGVVHCPKDRKGQVENIKTQAVVIFLSGGVETDVSMSWNGCRAAISNHTSDGWLLSKAAIAALAKLDPAFR